MNMEILMQPNLRVMANIGEQAVFANKDYRFMKHCLITDVDNGKLIFNGLTRALIFLRNDEINSIGNINQYDFLYKYYFLVSEDFNEEEVVDRIRENLKTPIDDLYLDHPEQFTILTTTKCNARCFYCYELPTKKKHHMTEDTAIKVGNYIVKVADRSKRINMHWFGGEPLFNMKVIDTITQIVRENGQQYTTTFTTNGYLFDKDLVLKAKNIWNTVHMQITLDGTEEIYNKVKNYIHKDPISPYKKVLNNIAMLLNNGIAVTIRMNLDFHNAENLKVLITELYNRFKLHPNLTMYVWPIFEEGDNIKTKDEHIEIYNTLEEIELLIKQYGYFIGTMPKSEIAYSQCMADDGKSVTISPDGDLGTCEHLIDRNFWGHIDDPSKKDMNELVYWRDYEKPLEICKDCPIYPSCIRPSKCVEMRKCDEQIKEWNIRKHTEGILRVYRTAKGKNNVNTLPTKLAENIN